MGGDEGPRLALSACQIFVARHPNAQLQLFGSLDQMAPWLKADNPAMTLVQAEQVIAMGENPRQALRHGQNSSMGLALKAVAQGQADACVTAGNTGALMALARYILGPVACLPRTALCRPLPTAAGPCWMLDLGASLEASTERLVALATAAAEQFGPSVNRPLRLALLNIGVEADKVPVPIQQAARWCAHSS